MKLHGNAALSWHGRVLLTPNQNGRLRESRERRARVGVQIAGKKCGNGMLRTGLDPTGADQCHILANQISGFAGAGIAIRSPTRELLVKLNIVERCGNGIISEDEANAASVSIENNLVSALEQSEGNTDVQVAPRIIPAPVLVAF